MWGHFLPLLTYGNYSVSDGALLSTLRHPSGQSAFPHWLHQPVLWREPAPNTKSALCQWWALVPLAFMWILQIISPWIKHNFLMLNCIFEFIHMHVMTVWSAVIEHYVMWFIKTCFWPRQHWPMDGVKRGLERHYSGRWPSHSYRRHRPLYGHELR